MVTEKVQKWVTAGLVVFLFGNVWAGTTVLDFSEFKTAAVRDWNQSNYADHMANTPAVVSEILTPKGGLDVRTQIANEQADFKYQN